MESANCSVSHQQLLNSIHHKVLNNWVDELSLEVIQPFCVANVVLAKGAHKCCSRVVGKGAGRGGSRKQTHTERKKRHERILYLGLKAWAVSHLV